tara:strand:+ start:6539 stop:7138 length:600 start_codon:yes stop_codon:yes gene_type:complete
MSVEEVRMSYNHSVEPPEDIKILIKNLIEYFPKEVTEKRELLHLLNVISTQNKKSCFNEFNKIVKTRWKDEYNGMFSSMIIKQNLYTEIYIELLKKLKTEDRNKVINIILESNLESNEIKTVGSFFGKWIIRSNMSIVKIEDYIKEKLKNRVGIIIYMFVTLASINKDLIPMNIYKNINQDELTTNHLMAYYDLEELIE